MKKLVSLESIACVVLILGTLAFLYYSDVSMTFGKQLIIEWCILAALIYFLIDNKILKIYLLYCFILTLPLAPMRYNRFAFFSLWTILLYGGYITLIKNKFNPRYMPAILNSLCIVAIINSIWTITQVFDIWFLVKPTFWHAGEAAGGASPNYSGLMGNSNIAGSYYGITLVAFFRKKWWMFLPLVLYGLAKTNAYGGIIVGVVGIGFYLLFVNWRVFLGFGAVSIVGLVAYAVNFESTGISKIHRLQMWKLILTDYCKLKPIVGWGLGQFEIASGVITKLFHEKFAEPGRWSHPHSSWLKVLFEQGSAGLIIVSLYVTGVLCKTARYIKKDKNVLILVSILVASIVSSGGHFLMETFVGIVPITILGVLTTIDKERI